MSAEVVAGPAVQAVDHLVRRDSLWLFSGYGTTAAVGLFFWIAAAFRVSPQVLGVDAALLSVVTAGAAIASSGIGSAMVVLLPQAGSSRARLVRIGYAAAASFGAVVGLLAAVGSSLAVDWAQSQQAAVVVAVVLMTVIWTLFNLEDQVFTGLDRTYLPLAVNLPANALKLLLLVVLTVPAFASDHPLVVATMAPAAVAVAVSVSVLLPRLCARPAPGPSAGPTLVAEFARFAVRDTGAIGVLTGVGLLTPFVVTAQAGPTQGALYALIFQMSVILDLIMIGVTTALAKNASTDHRAGVALSQRLLKTTVLVVAGAGALATAAVPLALQLLGRGYDPTQGALLMGILALGAVARTPFGIWSSLMRARSQIVPVLRANVVTAAVVVASLGVLTPLWGALGAAVAVMLGGLWATGRGVRGLHQLRQESIGQEVV